MGLGLELRKPQIYCLGASHKSASVAYREYLYLRPESLTALLPQIKSQFNFDEVMVLSTCNRFEFYVFSKGRKLSNSTLLFAFQSLQKMAGKKLPPEESFRDNTYYFEGITALEHIFAVASSLDSMIVGETQITGQFKEAVNLAANAQTMGSHLDRLSQEVLKTTKKSSIKNQNK